MWEISPSRSPKKAQDFKFRFIYSLPLPLLLKIGVDVTSALQNLYNDFSFNINF